jgi:hypothetical protein
MSEWKTLGEIFEKHGECDVARPDWCPLIPAEKLTKKE